MQNQISSTKIKVVKQIGNMKMTNSTVNKNENTLKSQIDSIESKLYALRLQVYNLESQQEQIELDPDDYEDQFDDMLDDNIPEIKIGTLTYSPSYVLKNVDPTAYRCGLNDYVDSLDVEDSDEYKELQEEFDQLQSDIEDLENEIEDLENQIANLTD